MTPSYLQSQKSRPPFLIFWSMLFAIGVALFGVAAFAQNDTAATSRNGVILSLDGPVTPPVADYLAREIGAASDAGKELIIIEVDTPGGLVDSMKTIIKAILASETPVATFVSPQGARSASAGLYIMYSAHVSAMAPATNTGAATPVEVGGSPGGDDSPLEEDPFERTTNPTPAEGGADEETADDAETREPDALRDADRTVDTGDLSETAEDVADAARDVRPTNVDNPLSSEDAMRAKVINDSVAYIRALAEKRGRNADWAESAVREAASVTANEALDLGVIDLIADDIDDLLSQIDGRTIAVASGDKILSTENIILEKVEPTFVEQILSFIANPNVAVILMSLATTGIIIEMWNPGSIFPGFVGLVCLALGLYSFQVLPFNWLPLALMGIGAFFMVIEAYSPTFGLAGASGLGLFGVGMYFLFPESLRVSPVVIGTILASAGAVLGLILWAVIGSRSHGPMIGADAIKKREGVVDDWNGKEGWVIVEGERWRARSDKPLSPGDKIRVVEVDGLILVVKQAKAGGFLGGLAPSDA
ncbi:MAG: nodulation protein NfeD [Marinicaulis sp.]|nr:nodulation protein NfeD [Marinicaulis sp.]NNL87515.1 nodulation protein NfeD [Marinicaulis sp.]